MLVLEENGFIIGLVQCKEAEIHGLWIDPARQGAGAGAVLLGAGEKLIQRAGYEFAWLTCSAFNSRALGFYQRQGYIETRRDREVHVSGIEVEEIRMERVLDGGGAGRAG